MRLLTAPRGARRIGILTLVVLGLTVALPPGTVPRGGHASLSWLWSWLHTGAAQAEPRKPAVPVQERGTAKGREHHVPADATRARGGAGTVPGHAPGALPGYSLPDQTGKPATTPAIGVFDPRTSRMMPEKSGRGSTVYQNADGSLTRRVYDHAVNYRAADGRWRPIDTALVKRADGRLGSAANSLDVSVARGVGGAGGQPLVSLTLPSGQVIAYDLDGAAAVVPKVHDATAVYAGILPGTDLELTALGSGLKETLILRSPDAPSSWLFPLHLTGATPARTGDGSIALLDSAGKAVARFPKGSMQDSKVQLPTGEPTSSDKVTYQVVEAGGGLALKVTADRAWLDDPARVYPVRVDPTSATDATGDAYVDNDPNTGSAQQNGNSLAVGTDGQPARSFIRFDSFASDGFAGTHITSARLRLFHTWSWDCTSHYPIYVHKVTEPWSPVGLSTSSLPGPAKTSAIGSLTITDNYPACTNTSADRSVGNWWWVNLNPGAFNDWSTGGANNGLAVTATESDTKGWKRFTSANYAYGSYSPYLELTYAYNVPPQVDAQYPTHGYASPTLTPELLASAQDPDGWPKSLTYDFVVYDKAGAKIADSGFISSRSWVVPAGKLTWGETYFWTVVASDGVYGSTSQTTNMLTTPVPQPLITSGLSPNGDKGFDADNGNYTTTVTDAAVATVGPALSVQRFYNSLDPRSGAFGSGWASMADARATESMDASGSLQTVVVTYPSGQDVAFGRNSDGTFSPPSGRFSSFAPVTGGGYKLTDKDATAYAFTRPTGTAGQYALTSITDAQGRTESSTFDASGQLATITSASGRRLSLTWQTPPGATTPHVATVATEPAVPGDSGTAQVWHYSYTGDKLTRVCPPTSTVDCWTYSYVTRSLYQSTVLNAGPHSYWRLNEAGGTVAKSTVVDRAGVDNASYADVALGQPGPLAGSTSTAAGFDGTASRVTLPADLIAGASYRSVSMWFKTSGGDGVLLGQSWDGDSAATTTGAYNPTLYVGSDGRLVGQFPTAPAAGELGSLVGYGSGRCLDVQGAAPTNGARLIIYDCHGGANQQWTLDSTGRLTTTINGVTKCMDAAGASTADGTDIIIWDCGPATNQQWKVLADGRIMGVQSGKCLDADSAGTANSTYIQLWPCKALPNSNQTWFGSRHAPMQTAALVADGQWHHVVLSASGTSQTLYLDGQQQATKSGIVQDIAEQHNYLGVGFLGGSWPDQSHASTASNVGTRDHFTGSIAEVAFFDTAMAADTVQHLYTAGGRVSDLLTSVVRPSGAVSAAVSYDAVTGDLTTLTDGNGGTWTRNAPVVAGTSQVYASAVLAGAPSEYWRMAETGAATAVNQVHGNAATYNSVTLGESGGPFADSTVAGFDGTSSFVRLPAADQQLFTGPEASASMWFKMPAGSTAGGVLLSFQTNEVAAGAIGGQLVPALYVGSDGKLRGKWCWCGNTSPPVTSAAVNDGTWHHVALTLGGNVQKLYLDGAAVGSLSLAPESFTANYAYVGAGFSYHWPSAPTDARGHFPGQIADVALYRSQLSDAQVSGQFAARDKSNGVYGKRSTVTDPAGRSLVTVNDVNTGRKVAEYDARGNKTQFGYDTAGFLRTIVDPNGNVTITEHDVRGNTISQTTCQDYSADKCSTVYNTYYPDATTKVLTPDPRNDVMLTARDGRSVSASDTTYLTSYAYDAQGNLTGVTDPLGRVTRTDYTDGVADAAVGGGLAPRGLVKKVTTPGGAVQTLEYLASGDLARVTDPTGKVTTFTYDALGRETSNTEVTDTFPAGLTTTFTYDGLNRVVSETSPPTTNRVTGAVHTAVTTTAYDADGNITSEKIADATGGDAPRTTTHTYNQYGQMASTTDPAGKSTGFEYDSSGRIVKETEPAGDVTSTRYDENGDLIEELHDNFTGDPNNPGAAEDLVLTSKAYDPAGRLASETDAEGTTLSYHYTDNGLVAEIDRTGISNGADTMERDTYDAAGNLVSQVTNNGATTETFAVDAANRTTSSTLDPSGLRRTSTFEYSGDDFQVAEVVSDPSGTVSKSETMYDPMGREVAHTQHNGLMAPVARWKLDETAGATAKDSAGNSPATGNSGVTWSTGHGGSAVFDGTTGRMLTTAPVVDSARSFTVAAWVKLADAAKTRKALGAMGDRQNAFDLRYDDSNRWEFVIKQTDTDNATSIAAASTTAPALDTWTHLVGVYDRGTGSIKLYVNGVLEDTDTTSKMFTGLGPFRIGSGVWNGIVGNRWQGSIADVQVYSQALTATQVASVYAGSAPAAGAGVVRTSQVTDQDGLATSVTDANGDTTYYGYDEAGQSVQTTSPAVQVETNGGTPVTASAVSWVGYDTFGEVTDEQDANGNRTVTGYDATGRATSTTLPPYTPPGSTTAITPTTSRAYDAMGQVTSVTDPLGNVTRFGYDQLGNLAKQTAPDGGVTTYAYDRVGNRLSTTDPTGAQSTATYDYLGRPKTSTNAVRQTGQSYTTTYTYTSAGWPSEVIAPSGAKTTTTYDNAGEPITTADAAGNVTSYAYDGAGRRVRTTAPDGTYDATAYDMAGRALSNSSYSAAGVLLRAESKSYDPNGNMLTAVDGRGTTTTFSYDATGVLTREVQPISANDAITTTFGYDLAGNRTRFTDGRGHAFITTYNSWNLPESSIEPATTAYPDTADRTYTVAYDAAGQPISEREPGGVSVTSTYDNMGRLRTQTGAGAEVATAARTFDYDRAGRMTALSSPGGTTAISYDDRGLPNSITGPSGNSTFTYTASGMMATRQDAAGTTTYGYDAADRLASVSNPSTAVQAAYSYNNLDQVSKITYGTSGNARWFTFDDLHRPTSDELKTPAGTPIAKITYGWDANGNETAKTTTGFSGSAANTYTYDLADRLTAWTHDGTTVDYAYDKSGNRLRNGSRNLAYDERNRLTGDGTTTYTYTPRGTLASAATGATVLHTTADAFGQVLSQESANGTQTYTYDALGRVLRTGFAYTGLGNDLAGDGSATYTRDPSGNLLGENTGSTQRLAWTDLHDDVVGQFTPTGSTLTASTTYDPLGRILATTAMIGSLGYQSEWTDSSSGRVNMAARWYNTDTGQFDTRDPADNDPVPDPVDANRYQYGDANPLTTTDPTGHWGMPSWAKKAWHATTSAVSHAYSSVSSMASSARSWAVDTMRAGYHRAVSFAYKAASVANHLASRGAKKLHLHKLSRTFEKRSKHYAHKAYSHQQQAKQYHARAKRAGHELKVKARRVVSKAVANVKDGYKATEHWVKDHKAAIVGLVVGVVIGTGCTISTLGMGAVGCAIAAGAIGGAIGSLATQGIECKDKGGDACSTKAFLTAGVSGAVFGGVGAVIGGPVGGKILKAALGKVAGSIGTRMADSAVVGAVSRRLAGALEGAGAVSRRLAASGSRLTALGGRALSAAAKAGRRAASALWKVAKWPWAVGKDNVKNWKAVLKVGGINVAAVGVSAGFCPVSGEVVLHRRSMVMQVACTTLVSSGANAGMKVGGGWDRGLALGLTAGPISGFSVGSIRNWGESLVHGDKDPGTLSDLDPGQDTPGYGSFPTGADW